MGEKKSAGAGAEKKEEVPVVAKEEKEKVQEEEDGEPVQKVAHLEYNLRCAAP